MARNAALLLLAVGAAASPAAERDGGKITLENFGRAAHEWQESIGTRGAQVLS